MKMIYHHNRSNNKFFNKKTVVFLVLVFTSIFVLLYPPTRSMLTRGVLAVGASMWSAQEIIRDTKNAIIANFKVKDVLLSENAALREELDRMQVQVLDRNLLAEKVIKLEESLGRTHSDDRVTANVIVGPGRSPYDVLVIDVGSEEGVVMGDMVVYAGAGVVGEVIEVAPFSAKVKLCSSPKEEYEAFVGAHNLPIVAIGRGMGNFEAKIPQDGNVAIGDMVIAKGSLILGAVSLIEEKPSLPFKQIFFRVPFNINEIRSVEVIKK